MPHLNDPEAMEQARRQVRFATNDIEALRPRENGRCESAPIRRQSQEFGQGVLFGNPTATVGHSEAGDSDVEEVVPDEATLEYFYTHVCDKDAQEHLRYTTTPQDFEEDLNARVQHDAAHYSKRPDRNGPCMPFKAMTTEGKACWPNWDGLMDVDRFQELTAKHPQAMFDEIKLRTFVMTNLFAQRGDVDHICRQLDQVLQLHIDWVGKLGRRVDELKGELNEADARCSKAVDEAGDQWVAQLAEYKEQIDTLRDQIISMAARTTAAPVREGTPSSSYTEGGTKRSAKVEHPAIFTNDAAAGSDKQVVKFPHWYMLLRGKLRKNSDHFDNDREKIDYIVSRMGGTASENILAFVSDEGGRKPLLKTSEEVLTHLYQLYHDPNEYENARIKYRDLFMKTGDNFNTFHIEFARWASQARINQADYKRDLHDKLPQRLNVQLVEKYNDEEVSFAAYCKAASMLDHQQHKNFANQRARGTDPAKTPTPAAGGNGRGNGGRRNAASGGGNTGGGGSPSVAGSGDNHHGIPVLGKASDGGNVYGKPNFEQAKRLIAGGQCFTCHAKGHRSPECGKKGDLERLTTTRISNIYAKAMGQTVTLTDEADSEKEKDVAQDN